MVLFFFLGMVMFFFGVSLPDSEATIRGWLIAIGGLLWAIGANPMMD